MQKIVPHLWFDKEAVEAAKFYTSVFKGKVKHKSTLYDTPSGDTDVVQFEILGQDFMAISAGPYFKFNPSISFLIACKTKAEVNSYWKKLADDGTPLMELGKYPFSDWYGWIQDKYGLSWQIMFFGDFPIKQNIIPTLLFVGNVVGKAEEAIKFYTKVFKKTKIIDIARYDEGEGPEKPGMVKHGRFAIEGLEFGILESAQNHDFAFNEAVSFIVNCADQKEIDYFWKKLSAVPESEQCGWLKDKYGVSWQIVPTAMDEMMKSKDKKAMARVTQAVLKMKKFDIKELDDAYNGL